MAEDALMGFPASDYAKSGKTDTLTFMGTRLALVGAAATLQNEKIDKGGYAEAARDALHKAVDKNKFLQAAGTQELVKKYFDDVIDRQGKDKKEDKLEKFVTDIQKSKAFPENWDELPLDDLASAGKTALQSANKNLGIKTLTGDFRDTISKSDVNKGITITPSVLDEKSATTLAKMEETFRRLDGLDDAAYKVLGAKFGNAPAVSQLLAHTHPEMEKSLSTIINAATDLRAGKDIEKNIKTIGEQTRAMGAKGEIPSDKFTAEEAKAVGQQVLNTVVKIRSEDATAEDLIQVIADKGKPHESKKPEQEKQSKAGNTLSDVVTALEELFSKPMEAIAMLTKALSGGQQNSISLAENFNPPAALGPNNSNTKDKGRS